MSTDINIIVNARQKTIAQTEITFEQLVELAGLESSGGVIYTVTYKKGPSENPEGMMVKGAAVKIQSGMIFNVTPTSKS